MLTLEEARKTQEKIQKKTVIKFFVYMSLIIAAFTIIFAFTDYFEKYSVLYALFIVLFFLACKYSNIHYLFRPKEFTGVIKYCNITIEQAKKYATHQPGAKYASSEIHMLDIIIENDKKTLRRTIEYDWHWGEFREGQTVTILRFIERPFLITETKDQV